MSGLERWWVVVATSLWGCLTGVGAQEFNCRVRVEASRMGGLDPAVVFELERTIATLFNERSWAGIELTAHEKVECDLLIEIEGVEGTAYRARATIQLSRPVYNSNYRSAIFKYVDEEFAFQYSAGQQLQYVDNSYTSELASLVGFYAYLLLGVDFDSFGELTGTNHYNKALEVATIAFSSSATPQGWSFTTRSRDNRYWLVSLLLEPSAKPFREALYIYHRKGLDVMFVDPMGGRAQVMRALRKLVEYARSASAQTLIRGFMDAKRDELIDMFSGATQEEKNELIRLCSQLDPANLHQYQRVMR